MYTAFRVENFRCFHDLQLSDLARVNLITGRNNVGKTSLLEALFIHCGGANPELIIRVNGWRGMEAISVSQGATPPWESVFRDFDTSAVAEMTGTFVISPGAGEARARGVKLVASVQPVEWQNVRDSLQRDRDRPTDSTTNPITAKVLELEYWENGREVGKCSAILDLRGLRFEPAPPPPFPGIFLPSLFPAKTADQVEWFGKLLKSGREEMVVRALRIIEPGLEELNTIVENGVPMLYGRTKDHRLMPLYLMGEGTVRLARLVLAIGNAKDGVVLADEIENGFHYSVLKDVWKAIGEAAESANAQVFATTHSRECIVAAYEAFSEKSPDVFRFFRLDRFNEEIKPVTYDQETLKGAFEIGLEVR